MRFGLYDESCKYVMDYDLLLRYERAGAKFKYIDETLAFYSLGGLTFTKFTKKRMDEIIRVLKQNGASHFHVLMYILYQLSKELIKKIVPKETLMRIMNR